MIHKMNHFTGMRIAEQYTRGLMYSELFNKLHVHGDNCMNLFSSLLNVPPNSLH